MKSLLEKKVCDPTPLPVVSLNHVSFLCSSLHESVRFYEEVLGFQLIRRPSSFDFQGAWFYNYGIGIHLVQSPEAVSKPSEINPKANHISFQVRVTGFASIAFDASSTDDFMKWQCADMGRVKQRLDQMGISYVTAVVTEGGIRVDQLFFHDPDNNMIEICDCEKLPIVPLSFPFAPLKTPQLVVVLHIQINHQQLHLCLSLCSFLFHGGLLLVLLSLRYIRLSLRMNVNSFN